MTTSALRENTYLPDRTFPINVFYVEDFPLHWHDHVEWIYVRHGAAQVQVDGSFCCLHAGELALVNARQLHGATMKEAGSQLVAIVFNESLLRNSGLDSTEQHYFSPLFNQGLQLPNFLHEDHPLTSEIRAAVGRLLAEFEAKDGGFELLIKAELFRIFGLLFRYGTELDGKAARVSVSPDFTQLLRYLRAHFASDISVPEAARFVNVSPNHFCKVFKRMTGKTLIEYVNLLRVNQAERLLVETDWPVTLIADKVGFGNISYFGRVFKAHKRQTPSAFRVRRAAGTGSLADGYMVVAPFSDSIPDEV